MGTYGGPRLRVVLRGGLAARGVFGRWSQTSWTPLATLIEGEKETPGNSLRDRTGGMVRVTRNERFFRETELA